jgi:hypothetical protein
MPLTVFCNTDPVFLEENMSSELYGTLQEKYFRLFFLAGI